MPQQQGTTRGVVTVDYPGVDDGIPLLSSFYFAFERRKTLSQPPGGRIDNHINSIRVLPAGNSVDLSPTADLGPSQVEPGKIDLTFVDKELKKNPHPAFYDQDWYQFKVAHTILPFANASRFQFRDVGCVGKCEQVLPKPPGINLPGFEPVFVLCGFKVFFVPSGEDHHLDSLAIYEDNGKLTVEFNDKNDDDTFGYLVDYALVSRTGMNIALGEASGNAIGGGRIDIESGPKVIRGFRFDLRRKDHEVREIGVLTSNERIDVFYSDQEDESSDRFDWSVRWASISPMVVDPEP